MSEWIPFCSPSDLRPGVRLRRYEPSAENPYYYASVVEFPDLDAQFFLVKYDRFFGTSKLYYACAGEFEIMKTEVSDNCQLDVEIDLIQNCIDSLHTCCSRLHSYSSQRISNRYKQPGKYLLKCKSKEIRGFLEKLNKSLLRWHDANLQELHNPAFHQYISDLAYIIRLVQYDSNLRQMDSGVLEALQHLYQALVGLIPVHESIQLSLFDSQVTFFEEIKESKFIHKIMIDFEWVPVLAGVSRLLRRFCEKVVTYPYPVSLVCSKSSWRSAFSSRQLSFADIS